MPEQDAPTVAVVVATRDRGELLPRLVAALEHQRYDAPFEVVIVDDASTDDTPRRLEDLRRRAKIRLRVLRLDRNRGPASARNAGWQGTAAPLVAFTDDDCTPDEGWLAALVRGLDAADLVQGRTVPDPAQVRNLGPFSRTIDVDGGSVMFETCNIGYRRDVLEKLDGFDERFRRPGGEDTDLAWRAIEAGARTTYAADALVLHDIRPSSFGAHLRLATRWSGVVLLVRRHPRVREQLHRRWFWKPSHPPAIAATAGLAIALCPGTTTARRVAGMFCVLPYVRFRLRTWPLLGSPVRRAAALPLALVADVTEVGTLITASVRYRTLLL